MMNRIRVFLLLLSFVSPLAAAPATDPAARLHDLFDRDWKWRLVESPQFATSVGVHDYDDRLGTVSAADEERRAIATWVLDNSGDLANLEAQVDRVWAELQRQAEEKAKETPAKP